MIDLVIPYVDSTDKAWQDLYTKYVASTVNILEFRGQGNFFKFFFRGVEKNMPWINKIFLIVQNKSQIPTWLDATKIKIIYHSDFIPWQYLPTFTSCTIEMFLWNIPGLSEQFIYANDDFFCVNKIFAKDYFENLSPKFNLDILPNINGITALYENHCINNSKLIYGQADTIYKLDHSFRPYLKSKMKECFDKYNTKILDSITKIRTIKNYNCYLYSLYLDSLKLRLPSTIKTDYIDAHSSPLVYKKRIENSQVICINDCSNEINIYQNINLLSIFLELFPNKSKYEL